MLLEGIARDQWHYMDLWETGCSTYIHCFLVQMVLVRILQFNLTKKLGFPKNHAEDILSVNIVEVNSVCPIQVRGKLVFSS